MHDALAQAHELGPTFLAEAPAGEELGHLTDVAVAGLREAGLFGVFVPAELGGYDLSLPEGVEVFRAVAEYDASTAWTLAILAGGGLLGRLVGDALPELVVDGSVLIAGSLNPMSASAIPVDGGYRLTGAATYASGCHHADWLMVAAWVERDGQRAVVDGIPDLRAGIVPIGEATILDTWHTTGMRGTGSDDCTVNDVEVADRFTFPWGDATWSEDDVWSRIPLLVQIGPALASTLVGAARGALDEFVHLADAKVPAGGFDRLADKAGAQRAVGEADGLLLAAEAALRAATEDVWAQALDGRRFDLDDRIRMRGRVVTAGQLATQVVDLLHGAAGMTAITRGSHLERAWRDVHTGTQHIMLNANRYEVTGRVRLGRDPGTPVV